MVQKKKITYENLLMLSLRKKATEVNSRENLDEYIHPLVDAGINNKQYMVRLEANINSKEESKNKTKHNKKPPSFFCFLPVQIIHSVS